MFKKNKCKILEFWLRRLLSWNQSFANRTPHPASYRVTKSRGRKNVLRLQSDQSPLAARLSFKKNRNTFLCPRLFVTRYDVNFRLIRKKKQLPVVVINIRSVQLKTVKLVLCEHAGVPGLSMTLQSQVSGPSRVLLWITVN